MKTSLRERDAAPGEEGMFTSYTGGKKNLRDELIILNDDGVAGWQVTMTPSPSGDTLNPQPGDTAYISMYKPFLSHDIFEFTVHQEGTDLSRVEQDLEKIKAVPNPYVVANSWEPKNPYASGRGPRQLHFIHLPPKCTIRIFNIQGQLVDTIEHDQPALWDGTEIWDMLSKDELDIAYGVYIFHVDAGDLGQKIGKFAVIK